MIKVFQKEIDDGLDLLVKSNASVSYTSSIILKDVKIVPPSEDAPGFMVASIEDLFPMNAILASTGWNLNDDVFDPQEMWAAKSTPIDKPFNMEHSQRDIIGHITGCYPIDDELMPISTDTPLDQIPDLFHLLTSSVIYKNYPDDPDFQSSIAQTINEIEDNQWFVSMECLFNGFDYAMQSANASHKVIERNDETAFLTKHLRAYQGTGAYNDQRVGRLMRNITFSGKGLVRKPANPNSIIFNARSKFTKADDNMVYLTNENGTSNNLPEKPTMDLETQLKEIKASLEKVTSEKEALAKQIADNQINSYQVKATELAEAVSKKDAEITELKASIETLGKTVTKAGEELAAVRAEKKDMEDKMDKFKKDKTKADRLSKLVAANYSKEDAEKLVATCENVDDAVFDAVVSITNKTVATAATSTVPETQTTKANKWVEFIHSLENSSDDSVTTAVASTDVAPASPAMVAVDYLSQFYGKSTK